MRTLIIGDIVGRTGRTAVFEHLPGLIDRLSLDFVIANGENATHGFGLSPEHATALLGAGVTTFWATTASTAKRSSR